MVENLETSLPQTENLALSKTTAWLENRPKKKGVAYYNEQKEKYEKYVKGIEFFTIPEALDAVNGRIISLLTFDVKSRKLIVISREMMELSFKKYQDFTESLG